MEAKPIELTEAESAQRVDEPLIERLNEVAAKMTVCSIVPWQMVAFAFLQDENERMLSAAAEAPDDRPFEKSDDERCELGWWLENAMGNSQKDCELQVFDDAAYLLENRSVRNAFVCPNCGSPRIVPGGLCSRSCKD